MIGIGRDCEGGFYHECGMVCHHQYGCAGARRGLVDSWHWLGVMKNQSARESLTTQRARLDLRI